MANKTKDIKNLVKKIADETELYDYQVRLVMNSFIRNVLTELANGKTVHLLSLGKFWMKKVEGKNIWNPQKREKRYVEERYIPKFTFASRAYYFARDEATKNITGEEHREPDKKVCSG